MSGWQTALMSIIGLCIGAAVAVVGAVYKTPELTNLGCTICGGALGAFVPQVQARAVRKPEPPRLG